MDKNQLNKRAKEVYDAIRSMFDEMGIHYELNEKDEGEFKAIHFSATGDDIPMEIFVEVDEEFQQMFMVSPLPVRFNDSNIKDAAFVICRINSNLRFGGFNMDEDGRVIFRFSHLFLDSLISKEAWAFMVQMCFRIIDAYNDKLLMFSKGICDADAVLKSE